MARKKMVTVEYTPAQKKAVDYFRNLCETDPEGAKEVLFSIDDLKCTGGIVHG